MRRPSDLQMRVLDELARHERGGVAAVTTPPIEIECLADTDGDPTCYWARGHLDAGAFLQAVGDWTWTLDAPVVGHAEDVRHRWLRWRPGRPGDDFLLWAVWRDHAERGAFAATVIDADDCDEASRCRSCQRWADVGELQWTEDGEAQQCEACCRAAEAEAAIEAAPEVGLP